MVFPAAIAACGNAVLFAYGTLIQPEVAESLLGRKLKPPLECRLQGFKRVCLKGRVYPGLFKDTSSSVNGLVYTDIIQSDWDILDAFEGEEYLRKPLPLEFEKKVFGYLLNPDFSNLIVNKDWDVHEFWSKSGKKYLEMCINFNASFHKYFGLDGAEPLTMGPREFSENDEKNEIY